MGIKDRTWIGCLGHFKTDKTAWSKHPEEQPLNNKMFWTNIYLRILFRKFWGQCKTHLLFILDLFYVLLYVWKCFLKRELNSVPSFETVVGLAS